MLHSSTSRCLAGTKLISTTRGTRDTNVAPVRQRSPCVRQFLLPVERGNQSILNVRGDNSGEVLVFPLSWKALDHQTEVMARGSVL